MNELNSDIVLAQKLLTYMDPSVIKNNVDMIIFISSCYNVSKDLFPHMVDYLLKCDYNPSLTDITEIWNGKMNLLVTMKDSRFTIRTLLWYMFKHSYITYCDIMISMHAKLICKENITTFDLADLIDKLFGHIYYYVPSNNKYAYGYEYGYGYWYVFNGIKWKRMVFIENVLINKLKKFISRAIYIIFCANIENSEYILQNLNMIFNKLKNKLYLKNLFDNHRIKMQKISEDNKSFISNENIVWFNNCIYDNKLKVYRNATPDDISTICVGYNNYEYMYHSPTDESQYHDHDLKNVYNFFEKIFPIKYERAVFLDFLTDAIFNNCIKTYILKAVDVSSGMSTLCQLLIRSFGEYVITGNICDFVEHINPKNIHARLLLINCDNRINQVMFDKIRNKFEYHNIIFVMDYKKTKYINIDPNNIFLLRSKFIAENEFDLNLNKDKYEFEMDVHMMDSIDELAPIFMWFILDHAF